MEQGTGKLSLYAPGRLDDSLVLDEGDLFHETKRDVCMHAGEHIE